MARDMGWIGETIGQGFGTIGGGLIGGAFGQGDAGKKVGKDVGGWLGGLLPFNKGGVIIVKPPVGLASGGRVPQRAPNTRGMSSMEYNWSQRNTGGPRVLNDGRPAQAYAAGGRVMLPSATLGGPAVVVRAPAMPKAPRKAKRFQRKR